MFKKDIEDLKSKGIVLTQNNLRQLNLFIDDENIVRVGGRFLIYNRTLSIHIYCINNHLTRFIIEHEHQKLMRRNKSNSSCDTTQILAVQGAPCSKKIIAKLHKMFQA